MSVETTSKPLTWLITGCSSGFGLALVRIAQAKGHHVIATSRNPARTPELVDEIKSKGGRWEALDLEDPNCGKVIEDLEKDDVAIDVLVNNAGMSFFCPTDVLEEADLKQLFETNFFGPWRLIKAAGPHMRQRRTGTVVNISSGGSIRTHACFSAYGSSKAALDVMSRTLQAEYAEFGLRVLLVNSGAFDTKIIPKVMDSVKPLDTSYHNTSMHMVHGLLQGKMVTPMADHFKAMEVLYDVIVGEGSGKGLEGEKIFPLGADVVGALQELIGTYNHAIEAFDPINKTELAVEDVTAEEWKARNGQ